MEGSNAKQAKLRTYRLLKNNLCFEEYLKHPDLRTREMMTRLRGGRDELRIEKEATEQRTEKILHDRERVCLVYVFEEVGDECHLDRLRGEHLTEKMFQLSKTSF